MSSSKTIAFLGLGVMGGPMAGSLIRRLPKGSHA